MRTTSLERRPGARATVMCVVLLLVVVPHPRATASEAEVAETLSLELANQIGVSLGVANLQVNDALVRGLRYDGISGELRLFFRHDGDDDLHVADVRFPAGYLENRYGHRAVAWDAQVAYGYARYVGDVFGAARVLVGGRVRWDWAVQYYIDFDEEHLYWANAYEVGPFVATRWQINQAHELTGQLDVPIAALVSRPQAHRTYKIDRLTHTSFFFEKTHEDLRLTSIHEHAAVRLELRHELAISEHMVLETRYAMDFARESDPKPVMIMQHALSSGVSYAF